MILLLGLKLVLNQVESMDILVVFLPLIATEASTFDRGVPI